MSRAGKGKRRIGLAVAALLIAGPLLAESASRHGAVYRSGEVRYSAASGPRLTNGFSCESQPDLAFRFSETALPDDLVVAGGAGTSGSVQLRLRVEEVCGPGSATFEYDHTLESSASGGDDPVRVQPRSPTLSVPLEVGAVSTVAIEYTIESERLRLAEATLFGDRITFVVDGTFGQASQRRVLARTRFEGVVIDTGLLPGADERRWRDAGDALNATCRAAESGSALAETCREILENATTTGLQRQAANAFDAHALGNISRASGQGGQLQANNVADRMAALRAGERGFSASGLSLDVNGQTLDTRWLPVALIARADDDSGPPRLFSDRLGAFVNGKLSIGERDRRAKEIGFDFELWGVTAGLDYRFDHGTVIGVASGFSRYRSDLDEDSGRLNGDTFSVQAYSSFAIGDGLYVDATGGWATTDFELYRVVDLSGIGSLTRTVAAGSTSTREWSASLAVNYRIAFDNGLSVTPYGQFYAADVTIDAFEESGSVFALRYPEQKRSSRRWSAGLRASKVFNLKRAVMQPYFDLAFQHEGSNDAYSLQPLLRTAGLPGALVEISDPDRDFGRVDAGVSWVRASGRQYFISYSALVMERDTSSHTVMFGARWEF